MILIHDPHRISSLAKGGDEEVVYLHDPARKSEVFPGLIAIVVISPSLSLILPGRAIGKRNAFGEMKRLSILSLGVILACLASPLSAQIQRVPTDKAPSAVFADPGAGRINVLTAGVDNAPYGTFDPDSGDVLPRWFAIDAATNTKADSLTFDGYFHSFPIRVGVDLAGHNLYVAQLGRVRAYDLETLKLTRDTVALGNYSGVSFDSLTGLLICHMRGGTKPGYIVAIDPGSGDTVGITDAGVEPQMTVGHFDPATYGQAFYTLNEGNFGGKNSSISYGSGNPDIFAAANGRALGGGGNYIAARDSIACIVMNGTHEIRVVNTLTHKELPVSPILTGTSSFNGPRTLAFYGNDTLVVATYAGDLRRFNLTTGTMIDSIPMPGKVETVLIRDSLAFAAMKYGLGGSGYDPDSTVVIVNLRTGRIVDSIRVGVDPGTMLFDKRGDLHVVGYGPATSAPWRMIFSNGNWAKKGEQALHGTLGFPLNVGYDATADSLYVAISDSVFAFPAYYTAGVGALAYSDPTAAGDLTGVTAANGYLLVTEPPKNFSAAAGYVHLVRIADRHRVAKSRAGSFLAMAVPVETNRKGAIGYYALNAGNFSTPSSTLSYVQIAQNIFGGDLLGGGANHMLDVGGDLFAVTMNGDHQIVFCSPESWSIEGRHPTGTQGFDGPRETALLRPDIMLVTTYSGDVRVFSKQGGYRTIPTGGKAEGLAVLNGKAYIANAFHVDDYGADSNVVVIDGAVLSVEHDAATATALSLDQNYPNPATDRTRIHVALKQAGDVQLALYSMTGEQVATLLDRRLEAGGYNIDISAGALPAGTYIYRLQSNGASITRTMQVVR